jgi:thioredoxin-dependent peroxiredoxin
MDGILKVGDKAPLFSLFSEEGAIIKLGDLIGLSPIILYFYPKDNTTVCTKEACAFRDNINEIKGIENTLVMGISSDSVDSHKQFSSDNELPFTLLSDQAGEVRKLYGVPKTFGLLPGRVTYVIDKAGIVRHIFSSQLNYQKHIEEALSALKSIKDRK